MKKLKILISCFVLILLGGCGNKKAEKTLLKAKQEVFTVEFGEPVSLDAETYLDINKLDQTQKKDVLEKSTLSVGMSQSDLINKESQNYPKVGLYEGLITYDEETLHFVIEVKDTVAPIITGPDEITIEVGQESDFASQFKATDLSDLKPIEIDTSLFNNQAAGNYSIKVIVKDMYENTQTKTVTVHVVEKQIVPPVDNNETTPPPANDDSNNKPVEQPKDEPQTPPQTMSTKLDVPYYNQMDVNASMGCEATSLYMGLKYKGYIQEGLYTFINNLPRTDNPHSGFSGDPFILDPDVDAYQGIFPGPLVTYGNQYGSCVNISGANIDQMVEELKNGNPIVAYVTLDFAKPIVKAYSFGSAVDNGHVVTLVGYDLNRNVFYLQDPYRSNLKEVSMDSFKNAYSALKYAVAIR